MRMRSYQVLLSIALLLATAGTVAAQEFRATVKGQVTDSTKGAVPGATVNVTNTDTNEVATAVSNAEGNYTIPFLRPWWTPRSGQRRRSCQPASCPPRDRT